METSLNHPVSEDLNGHHSNYGGENKTEHLAGHHHSNYTPRKKSNLRLNDQLIPKPTDINIATKMIKVPTVKEHPYSSHMSRFAMFPSYQSPDDPHTGVRAASQSSLNPLVPNSAPDVTLLRKTIGGPYRHEVLETPGKTKKKAVTWSGEHGFLDYPKPLKGESQVFYPTPIKTVAPNPQLRNWDLTLPERTSNMLKNLERTHWLTSYQMHYTGFGPANPLKMDDFMEKINSFTGINTNLAPLREKSHPVFVPSKPREGCRRRKGTADLPNPFPSAHQAAPESTAEDNDVPELNLKGQSQSEYSCDSAEAGSAGLSQRLLHKQQAESSSSVCEGRPREKVQFDESSVSQSSQEANTSQTADTDQPLHKHPLSHGEKEKTSIIRDELSDKREYFKAATHLYNQEKIPESRELPRSISNPCILPRPSVLPDIRHVERARTDHGKCAASGLIDLQNTFTKTNAHHSFNTSIKRAAVNLRDNVDMGKKHNFYGINCWYLHG